EVVVQEPTFGQGKAGRTTAALTRSGSARPTTSGEGPQRTPIETIRRGVALHTPSAVSRHDTYLKEKTTTVNVLAISWLAFRASAGLQDDRRRPQPRSSAIPGSPAAVQGAGFADGGFLARAGLASDRCDYPGRGRDLGHRPECVAGHRQPEVCQSAAA